ncbi:hypothetical protein DERF_002669 [Dermatophagoides farinae]|uniref:Endonuclease/exonuclease/phosphatase domain-containing protein n=1 Tax=Dermatophagoides farinae TaxID=6954 RepID=A0A922IDK3_DERFA|nr:hypothetical protein DERF_002669 [Dermatophagoides farinae]
MQQPIPNDHSTTYNDDDMQFSPILDNRKDKRNLTTTIEKINNNCNDNNSNLSYASDTDVMSAQLALNELMDVNGTIRRHQITCHRCIKYNTGLAKRTRNQLNLGSVVSIDGNENAENVRKEIAQRIVPTHMVSGSKKRPVYPTMDMDNAIEVCFERPNKNPQKFANFGIRVTPAIRDIIINRLQGRVNIDYNYVHAEDMNPLHRCYKCQGFNHHQNNCREDRPTCLHCGGDHYYEQCHLRNELPFCTNCFKNRITDVPSHRTTDTRCPVYQRMLKRVVIEFNMSRHAKNFPDINEPPIRKGVPNINKKFSPFYVTPSDNSSRVRSCICILNPSIQPMIISHLSNHDFIAIQIGDIIITSAYATPSYDITPILHRIADVSNYGGGRGLIIAGDFNASHKHWFAKYIDKRGEELLATLLQYNLDTINDCDIPTYDTIRANRRLTSYIDLTIASSTIINHIRNWRVVDDVNMSDHRAIVFDIVNKPNLITVSSTTRWNTTNVDWESWAKLNSARA